ncbi:MAG: DUF3536 domain-containing protein [Bryobacteraceae bacterium]|nr:DUF3536 domain-containing protein [Bryobacteraceae bacterium]
MKYLCVHAHFYQPPRENPWLETIELQDSAYPYHDWNERIDAECYGPNSASRVLDGDHRIVDIVNNYSQISFNVGPTLLSWMQKHSPANYCRVLEADRLSAERFGGHGSAMAQCYNHLIMPLANRRDKRTQIRWGIRDFLHRFKRPPEGMWLPETAVDEESLDIMAEHGVRFTVLAPYQCRRVRKIGGRSWKDVTGGRIDPTRAYRVRLPSSRTINVFFYDGPISRAVAFERLLDSGERLAQRMLDTAPLEERPRLLHIATDGETYGHHHRHGEMALTYALRHVAEKNLAQITNYAQFLELFPPAHEVEIYPNTAWSCSHGVQRWNSDCGCQAGGGRGWRQGWRGPLRQALDWLRDTLAPLYEREASKLLKDPWAARDDYINVVLNRCPESRAAFLAQHAVRPLDHDDEVLCWRLLEVQRHAMLMYTSCGWFFDELSGIETVQVIAYAARAVQLSGLLFEDRIEEPFLERLARAKSNLPEHGDGRVIFEKWVRPAMVDLRKVAAHYAISSLFGEEESRAYCYTAVSEDRFELFSGPMRFTMGRAWFTSEITRHRQLLTYGVLHFGDHNVTGGVREFQGPEAYDALSAAVRTAFDRADIPEVLRLMDSGFGKNVYSLKTLFRDEQRKVIRTILNASLDEAGSLYRQLYERYAPMMSFLADLSVPLPKVFESTAEYAINSSLRRAFRHGEPDLDRVRALVAEASKRHVELDSTTLEYSFRQRMDALAAALEAEPLHTFLLEQLDELLDVTRLLPFPVSTWSVQNSCFSLMRGMLPVMCERAAAGDTEAAKWESLFRRVCDRCGVRLP